MTFAHLGAGGTFETHDRHDLALLLFLKRVTVCVFSLVSYVTCRKKCDIGLAQETLITSIFLSTYSH